MAALDASGKYGASDSYAIFRKKDGSPGYLDNSDAANAAGFNSVLDHVRRKLGELADGILTGDVSPRPYRLGTFSPCSWCEMATACRYDSSFEPARHLDTMKRSDIRNS
jgi:ATP-dependent helicase/DNAse subunit B